MGSGTKRAVRKVGAYLRSSGLSYQATDDETFLVVGGSTGVGVWINFFEVDDLLSDGTVTILTLRSFLTMGVSPSADLYRHIATQPPAVGALSVVEDDDGETSVILTHAMLADYLDEPEFRYLLLMIVAIADTLADEFAATYGGRRMGLPDE